MSLTNGRQERQKFKHKQIFLWEIEFVVILFGLHGNRNVLLRLLLYFASSQIYGVQGMEVKHT